MDQSFQRRLIERSMQGNAAKFRRRQQVSSATCCGWPIKAL
jgi:hypothetical protein